jgi:hypothetical protein
MIMVPWAWRTTARRSTSSTGMVWRGRAAAARRPRPAGPGTRPGGRPGPGPQNGPTGESYGHQPGLLAGSHRDGVAVGAG